MFIICSSVMSWIFSIYWIDVHLFHSYSQDFELWFCTTITTLCWRLTLSTGPLVPHRSPIPKSAWPALLPRPLHTTFRIKNPSEWRIELLFFGWQQCRHSNSYVMTSFAKESVITPWLEKTNHRNVFPVLEVRMGWCSGPCMGIISYI